MNKKYALLNNRIILDSLINLRQVTFEVTDACNLKCKYCGYGELYDDYDKRSNNNISLNKAVILLDYLENMWKSNYSKSYKKITYISFYGGEPLLNMNFIENIVSLIEKKSISNCDFRFSMTTNGVLLKKQIDYLVEHNFNILVSLDGNEYNHSYRVDRNGENSFERIFDNLLYIRELYPDFFLNNINFNAVLHNRNNYVELNKYFENTFGKKPSISELSPNGIREDKLDLFSYMYNNKVENLENSEDRNYKNNFSIDNPFVSGLSTFLNQHSGNVFRTYNELLNNDINRKWIPTGTCTPFNRKLFLTVNGKILPCERISQEYYLGYVDDEKVNLNIDDIVDKYNSYYEKYIPQCSVCYHNHTCKECIFYNKNLNSSAICNSMMNRNSFEKYSERQYKFLSENPTLYRRLMEEVIIH
jgi:uncharacterized protein